MMSSLQNLSLQAGFVFEGVVEQLGASTASEYPSSAQTAIVQITKILKSSSALAMYVGERITVQLQNASSFKQGQQAVFFTNGIHFGDSLVVNEVGSAPVGQAASQETVNSAVQAESDAALTQRLAQADLVVSGTASQVGPLKLAAPMAAGAGAPTQKPVSEHDPDWWQATINVDSVEKGENPGATTSVIFPHSMDIAWYKSPKIKEGDSGTWLLHNRDLFGRAVPAHAVIHPLDFQPSTEQDRVRTLLKTPR